MNEQVLQEFEKTLRPYATSVDFQFYCQGEIEETAVDASLKSIFTGARVTRFVLWDEDWPIKFTLFTVSLDELPPNVEKKLEAALMALLCWSENVFALLEGCFSVDVLDSTWVTQQTYAIASLTAAPQVQVCIDTLARQSAEWHEKIVAFHAELYAEYPLFRNP